MHKLPPSLKEKPPQSPNLFSLAQVLFESPVIGVLQ